MDSYPSSDTSDSDEFNNKVIDLAYLLLDPNTVEDKFNDYDDDKNSFIHVESAVLHHNQLSRLPGNLKLFSNLRVLDVSNNGLTVLPNVLEYLSLNTLIARNNHLNNDSLPKCFSKCEALRELNLSGNRLQQFPEQILEFTNLKFLYLGGNGMTHISRNIWKLRK